MRGLQATDGTPLIASRPPLQPGRAWGLIGAVGVGGLVLDQVTKALAVRWLTPGEPVRLLGGWFQLRLSRNPGAAFSLGEDFTLVFTTLAAAVLVAGTWWAVRRVRSRWWSVLVGLGLAGVAGNLTDRLVRPPGVFRGHVVDFLFVRHFATFNVADACLTVAAACLILAVARGWSEAGGPRVPEPKGQRA